VLLGAHESIAGGFPRSIERALADGCRSVQVFTKNAGAWAAKPIDPAAARLFREGLKANRLAAMAHDAYLINLAAPDPVLFERSVAAFAEELRRCATLGIPRLVMHPGSPMDRDEAWGVARVAAGIDDAFDRAHVRGVRVLLETTAGQGRHLGWRFEHLAGILAAARSARRIGVCVDTCHLLAAGYDWTTPKGYRSVWRAFDAVVGLSRVEAFHLNDSKGALGCRVDRHEVIGRGCIGLEPFGRLVRDRRFASTPAVLETPPLPDGSMSFAHGIALLRSLEARPGRAARA
jgi:deoxyribonuclease-4